MTARSEAQRQLAAANKAFRVAIEAHMTPAERREHRRAEKAEAERRRKAADRFERLLKPHAPPDLEAERLRSIAEKSSGRGSVSVIVLAADIRRSTFVMKEVVEFSLFAAALGGFVDTTRRSIGANGGWWDKFTGDGFLSYWIYDEDTEPLDEALAALEACVKMFRQFDSKTIPSLRANSRNYPAGVGLSIGLDAGPAHLVEIAGDLTVVGTPVVGAVRMVGAARPWEVVSNNYLGEWILRATERFEPVDQVNRECRSTKEYESQEVYVVRLHGYSPAGDAPSRSS